MSAEHIDLQPFCSKEVTRYYITKPWSLGEWTYATNGHICLRVPRREGVPENTENPAKAEKIFANHPPGPLRLFRGADLPELETDDTICLDCEGRGHLHDCPECECGCDTCDGSGHDPFTEKRSVGIGGVPFHAHYIRLIQKLPGLRVPETVKDKQPMPFTFDGGEGVLMPTNRQLKEHVEESRQ